MREHSVAAVGGSEQRNSVVPQSAGSPDAPDAVRPETAVAESLADRCARIAAKFQLSARESEVFVLLAQGHTRASIAKKLFVSENTIREHVKSIYKKLYIHSRQQLIDMVDARK